MQDAVSPSRGGRGAGGSAAPYVALLRGINVGGVNLIPMAALRHAFESAGFGNVTTYIQSGNVLFHATEPDTAKLAARIERALARDFGYGGQVVLRSQAQMHAIVTQAPAGFGTKPLIHRYDVVFLKEPLRASDALAAVRTREGVDQAHAGEGVLYFSRLISRATSSYLSRLASQPIYQQVTIRNWNTTTKLLALMMRE